MFKDKTLLLPFIAFILLHIGQWMYTMNMPLFVTDYLKENEQHVGYLASLCWFRSAIYDHSWRFII